MDKTPSVHTPGKIILSGDHAVVFGEPGIALPAPIGLTATYTENLDLFDIKTQWNGITAQTRKGKRLWEQYLQSIVDYCITTGNVRPGRLVIDNHLPLGKGMGSSTALIVTVARSLLGSGCHDEALAIEDALNPGHSGIDFAVIWRKESLLFCKEAEPQPIDMPLPEDVILIDTGEPQETTAELIEWVQTRRDDPAVSDAVTAIGRCTQRLADGEAPAAVLPDHHRAQIALGVVPENVQKCIAAIEDAGGTAKVIGAGGRAGGAGVVLALHEDKEVVERIAGQRGYETIEN